MEEEKSFQWRIKIAVVLTSLGAFYYLWFLAYITRGIPMEKIHGIMTDNWPEYMADYIPLIAPTFLFVGLYLWYSHNQKIKPKPIAEPSYDFEIKKIEKPTQVFPEAGQQFVNEEPTAPLPEVTYRQSHSKK